MLTDKELQSLRNMGNEAEAAADEIAELRFRLDRVHYLDAGDVSRKVDVAVRTMDAAIVAAINAAKDAGVPQGFIVGLLHGLAHAQTAAMIDDA